MAGELETITPSGARARKGTKGFLKSTEPQRCSRVQARLSEEEMKVLQRLYKSRKCSMSQLIRDMIHAVSLQDEG